MNVLFIDTETTGTDPTKHSLIQIAAELHKDGLCVAKFNRTIKHDQVSVDLGALKVNRIGLGRLDSYGLPLKVVLTEFVDFLLDINGRYSDVVVCGHNVNFDVQFITEALRSIGVSNLSALLPFRVLDTASIGLYLHSAGKLDTKGKFSLSALMAALKIKEPESRHEASTDVECVSQVLYALQNLLKEKSE